MPIDTPFLHSLRSRLHSIRKCFSGSEFVEAIIKIGQERQEQATLTSDSGQTFVYNQSYATQIGQYLLDEGILVCLLQYGGDQLTNGQVLESASAERMNAVDTTHHTAAEQQHFGRTLASPRIISSPASSTSSQSVTSLHEEDALPRVFKNSSLCLYRFVDMEDQESGFVLHSMQVLTAALSSQRANGSRQQNQPQQERRRRESDLSDFDRARLTTQLMITDILQQRVRRDKQAKIFLVSPHALQVMERADQQNIHTILRTWHLVTFLWFSVKISTNLPLNQFCYNYSANVWFAYIVRIVYNFSYLYNYTCVKVLFLLFLCLKQIAGSMWMVIYQKLWLSKKHCRLYS